MQHHELDCCAPACMGCLTCSLLHACSQVQVHRLAELHCLLTLS